MSIRADVEIADMRKEEWGLLTARVELFQGAIWATWDHSAPWGPIAEASQGGRAADLGTN